MATMLGVMVMVGIIGVGATAMAGTDLGMATITITTTGHTAITAEEEATTIATILFAISILLRLEGDPICLPPALEAMIPDIEAVPIDPASTIGALRVEILARTEVELHPEERLG